MPPPPNEATETFDNKSERLAVSCRVTWALSETVNTRMCGRQIAVPPRKAKHMQHNRSLGPLSGLPDSGNFYSLPPTLVSTDFKYTL